MAQAPAAPPAPKCRTCGKKAVWESDGVAADKLAACREHLPANVTREMVRAFGAR